MQPDSSPDATPLEVVSRGQIFDAARESPIHRIACFTSLCRLASGRILCGFQNGPTKQAATGTVRLAESSDGGHSWNPILFEFVTTFDGTPGSLAAIELVEPEPGRLLAFATWFDRSEPERPLFDPETEGILRSKQLWAESRDEGRTWTAWQALDLGELRGTALTGPVLCWHDGTIGFALESFKEFDDPAPGRHAAWLLVSRDGGRSFQSPALVAQHPEGRVYYWDQRLCVGRRPGELTAMFWTHDLADRRDLTVHLRHATLAGTKLRVSPIIETNIPGQIAAPLWLGDGRLLAFLVDRGDPATLTLWCSTDRGATWPQTQRLVIYRHDERAALSQGADNIDFKQYWEDMGRWSFGHPAICQLDDSHVLLAWYAGTPSCMSVHWARVRVGTAR